ncbi:MAG: hypothetical protein J7498_11190 [Sphingobium sp.]|nr:hypothetical protein [Sphingobium sp.]
MANPTTRQLWNLGIPLDSAWLKFASAEMRRLHSELPTLAKFNREAKADLKAGAGLNKLMQSAVSQMHSRVNFEHSLRELLLDQLFNSELSAFGFRTSPSVSRSPVRIEADLFDNHTPDWKRETLNARGREYAEIRIVDLTQIQDFQRPRTGRKGSAAAIRSTIEDLLAEGVPLCGMRRDEACNVIIARLGSNHPDGSGLSLTNLPKYILEYCPKRGLDN